MTRTNTRRLVESGILLALGFILSFLKIEIIPSASITLISMLPVILLAYKYGTTWGLLCGLVHGLLQMVEGGIDTPPTQDVWSYFLVVMLDYLLAFSVLGLAGMVRKVSDNPSIAIAVCVIFGIACRFVCSYLSGAIIWGVYAPEGQSPWLYSFVINGTKFGVEMAYTAIIAALMLKMPVIQKNLTPNFKTVSKSPDLTK